MADDIVAGWQRKSLYYYPQAEWGIYQNGSSHYHRLRETSRSFPYVPPPVVIPADGMGRGLPYADEADFYLGRPGGTFQTTHPMTPTSVRDLLMLLFNGHHYDTVGPPIYRTISPDDGGTPVVVVWTPTLVKFASLCVLMDSDAEPTSALKVTSAVVSQLDFNWPQNTPGDTSGVCEITPTWIFESSARASSGAIGTTPTEDAGIFQYTKDWTFKIAGSARDFISGNLSITNGAQLEATAAATAPGAVFGRLGATGSVTTYLNQAEGEAGSTTDDLMTLLEGATSQPTESQISFTFHEAHADSDDVNIVLDVVITGPPTLSDIGGIAALTFNFTMAGDTDAPPHIVFHDHESFDAGLFN